MRQLDTVRCKNNSPLAAHEHTDGTTLTRSVTQQSSSDCAPSEFAKPSNHTKHDNVAPCFAAIEEAEISGQAGKYKVLKSASTTQRSTHDREE